MDAGSSSATSFTEQTLKNTHVKAMEAETLALVREFQKQSKEDPSTTDGTDPYPLKEAILGLPQKKKPPPQPIEKKSFDPEAVLNTLISSYEMIVFSKTYCPYSKRAKAILSSYEIDPAPLFYELDVEDHGVEIQTALKGMTERATVPNIVIGGVSFFSIIVSRHD